MNRTDVAVVGGGIVGLAFAWEAARRGRSVTVFERDEVARGASVRNFGMIWPIGQPPGPLYQLAMRSRGRWQELGDEAGVWTNACGSVHAVYEPDEDAVLQEFAAAADPREVACEYVPGEDAAERFPNLNPDGLRGVLYSPTELAVDPRQAIARLPVYLHSKFGVDVRFATAVTHVEPGRLRTAAGDGWHAERVFVCTGTDFETLFPDLYRTAGIRRCKLQMMRTAPQPGRWKLGPHLAGGLTLAHYKSFQDCPSLDAVKRRFAADMSEYMRLGIHVMASQNHLGEVVIGDSHEYDIDVQPFDSPYIDGLILDYLRRMLRLPDWTPTARWHGVYAKHPTKPVVMEEPHPGCTAVVAPGGAGMTLSFGFAADWWDRHGG